MRLIDVLCNWDALAARVPLGQWRFAGPTEGLDVYECCYVVDDRGNRRAKACTHRDPDMVPEGKTFLKALRSSGEDDPMAVVALKTDIDRQLALLPRLPRQLFALMYQQGGHFESEGRGRRKWVSHNLTMDQARQTLHIRTLRDVATCHDLHMTRMERALRDWFPPLRQPIAA